MGRKAHIEYLKEFRKNANNEIPIERMILFGSRATSRAHKQSDFDLIIVSKSFKDQKFRYRALGLRKYWSLDYPVDFLCYSPEEFKKLSKEVSLVSKAIKEGIVI